MDNKYICSCCGADLSYDSHMDKCLNSNKGKQIKEGLEDLLRILSDRANYQKVGDRLLILTLSPKGKQALDLLNIEYTTIHQCIQISKDAYTQLVKEAERF